MGTPLYFHAIFIRGDNFCDFLIASLDDKFFIIGSDLKDSDLKDDPNQEDRSK